MSMIAGPAALAGPKNDALLFLMRKTTLEWTANSRNLAVFCGMLALNQTWDSSVTRLPAETVRRQR